MTSFKDLYTKFRGLLQESWLTNDVAAHFGPTATLDSMFRYLWSRPEAQQELVPPPGNNRISRKGASEAEKFRNEGNRLYREKKLDQALLAYNYSILAAPHPGLEDAKEPQHEGLCLAFANRSAVLYEMNQYKDALADAERALTLGYPPSKRHRLHERRAKCLQAMGKMDEAKAVLEDTLNALSSMSLDEKEATTVKKNITNLKTKCESKQTMASPSSLRYQHVFYTGPKRPPSVSCPRPDLPCLSDAISIQYTPIRGRHVVAARDIQPGKTRTSPPLPVRY